MATGKDPLGDRMKHHEAGESARRLDPSRPACVRLDGRGFSRLTRGFAKPFDPDISEAMRAAAVHLLETTHARVAYVQSDEISLVFDAPGPDGSILFDGRVQKMASVFAATATLVFALALGRSHPDIVTRRLPVFDGRAWSVPSRAEAVDVLLWRAQDARRNAVNAVARQHFSFRALQGRSCSEMRAMLAAKGVDFEADYDPRDRFGTFWRRVRRETTLSEEELSRIPEAHRPTGAVLRTRTEALPPIWFGAIANPVEVIFEGGEPLFRSPAA